MLLNYPEKSCVDDFVVLKTVPQFVTKKKGEEHYILIVFIMYIDF